MGTRNLTMVISGGEVKVAQYGQWDGHLDSSGKVVADFIVKADLESFKQKVDKCEFVTYENYIKDKWTEAGADPNSDLVSFGVSDKFHAMFPELSRDTGAGILDLINNSNGLKIKNSIDFVSDSLFCEYAYVVDLDNGILEVYEGFNNRPPHKSERFADFPIENPSSLGNQYYPVGLVAEIPFEEIDEFTMRALENFLYPADEDEEEAV